MDNIYMARYMTERYRRRRLDSLQQLGGRCVDCGDNQRLEFDHVDPLMKAYSLGKILSTGSEAKVQAELAKCVLRCHDCHKRKTRENHDIARGRSRNTGP